MIIVREKLPSTRGKLVDVNCKIVLTQMLVLLHKIIYLVNFFVAVITVITVINTKPMHEF